MHPARNSLLDKAARIGWLFTAAAMLLVFSQFLSPALVDEKRYIRESYEIRLKDYEVVAHEFFHHFFPSRGAHLPHQGRRPLLRLLLL